MRKLRLILFKHCNRRCKGCCNKDWDIDSLPVCTDFTGYDQIMLTGGEPMLNPGLVANTVTRIWQQGVTAPIYMYTAKTDDKAVLLKCLTFLEGITVTLHTQKDVKPFLEFETERVRIQATGSLRLNIFKGVKLPLVNLTDWVVKDNIVWIKNCPLPPDEVLMRL